MRTQREQYELANIPAGEYALLVYFDENDNGKMDKNFIGIPTEPLGFSNDYKPKGPPSYSRAMFLLAEDEQKKFTVELYRPLGERGRLGVGLGVIGRSSPYRDYDGGVTQVIPAISYNGARLQILGPNIQFGLLGSGKLRLAAVGSYRIGVYEEDDSDYLNGMGDRDSTFMAGLGLRAELPAGAAGLQVIVEPAALRFAELPVEGAVDHDLVLLALHVRGTSPFSFSGARGP